MLLEQGFLTRITMNHTGIEKHPETLVPFYINYLQNFHKPNLSYLSCILNYIIFWKHKLPEDRQPLTRTTRYRLLLSDINFWRRCRGVSAYSRDNFFFGNFVLFSIHFVFLLVIFFIIYLFCCFDLFCFTVHERLG